MFSVSSKPDIERILQSVSELKSQLSLLNHEISTCDIRIRTLEQEIGFLLYDSNEKETISLMKQTHRNIGPDDMEYRQAKAKIEVMKREVLVENQKKNNLIYKSKEIEDEIKRLIHLKNAPVGGMDFDPL
jgi:chromosome segregation ATPase